MDRVRLDAPSIHRGVSGDERCVKTHPTCSAKQLMLALRRAVERHEAMYGMLELDPRKRLTPAVREMLVQQSSEPSDNAAADGAGQDDGGENGENIIH